MMETLHQMVRDGRRRAMMAVARGVLSAIVDTTRAQSVQIQMLDGEVADQVERFQQYGFSSVPHPGAEAVSVQVGGLRSHGIVIAVEDRRYRLVGGAAGEVVLYDDQGQQIALRRDGVHIATSLKVVIAASGDVDVTAGGDLNATVTGHAVIAAASVALGGTGGAAVARVGDTVAGGVITSGSAMVTSA